MDYFRPADSRGKAYYGWLNSRYSFSFAGYFDPQHMGFSVLRVINDDYVVGGAGFDSHGHRDMEIISYVQQGVMEHKDSLGNRFLIPAGEVQRMSAGTGITHSEYNQSKSEPLNFLQIWVLPNKKGIAPSYEQGSIQQEGALTPLVTAAGFGNSLSIHQDLNLYRIQLKPSEQLNLTLEHRCGYLHVIAGSAFCEKTAQHESSPTAKNLSAGDGVGVAGPCQLQLESSSGEFEALWFDMPL